MERREAIARGERFVINDHWEVQAGFTKRTDNLNTQSFYSPDLQMVFQLESPGFFPGEPNYYLFDGAWYVYEPRSYGDPSLHIRAVPRDAHQRELLAEKRRDLERQIRRRGLEPRESGGAGQGFEMVVASSMPSALAAIVGNRETTIRVTGRESISFAGESRRVSPFIQSEGGRGQSLFPRLDMEQDLQVKLEGTVGGKVHLAVDHNSSGFGSDANRINIWYEGFEDDIVRRIDLGSTNLTLPGSNLVSFAGGSQGLFGVKTDMRMGGLDLTVIASKEETETESRTLTPSGASSTLVPVAEKRFIRDRFFFYEFPDIDSIELYNSWGIDPNILIDQNRLGNFHIFLDDRNVNNEQDRNFTGYAVAQLPPGLDDAAMDDAFRAAPGTARWPDDANPIPDSTTAKWRLLDDNEVGWVFHDLADGQRRVMGFYLRIGQLDDNDVLAVSFDSELGGTVGAVDYDAATVKLRLIRHPSQGAVTDEATFLQYPTNLLMMRHVYPLGSSNIQDLEVVVETRAADDQTPDTPRNLPNSTFLHMFGLDEFDQANAPVPDGEFDQFRANLVDRENGFMFMPGLRPFSPPDAIVTQRLISAGIDPVRANNPAARDTLFGTSEIIAKELYILPDDPTLPGDLYDILVRTTGTETEITLPQDIEEGSDRVLLDGRELARGVDYDIEPFAGGRITFKGDVLNDITADSRIEVSYRYRPLIGSGQATLFGASGQYDLGQRGRFASVWLFETRRGFSDRPRLGEEPTRTLLGDVNGNLRFQPGWMTGLANLLPFTSTNAPSNLQLTGEVAMSVPNPNTKNVAFVDDMEGADDSDRVTSARSAWHWASIPNFAGARADTINRIDVGWFNPRGLVKRGHLNPELDASEADDGLTVLQLGFHRDQVRKLVDSTLVDPRDLWSGVMTAFGGNGLDLTQTRTIEFWLNDMISDPTMRRGRMHIDFGDISEDFILYHNNPNRPGGPLTQPNFNREAERQTEFLPGEQDLGFNGVDDNCDAIKALEDNDSIVPLAWPSSDCHLASIRNPDLQHAWANGSQGNNEYDTEDINRDGEFDQTDRYFRYSMDLADLEFVDVDVSPQYGNRDFGELNAGFQGWRRYRIDFAKIRSRLEDISLPGSGAPSLRQIRYVRIWFDDPDASMAANEQIWMRDIQLHDFKFTGNQWLQLGVYAADSTSVPPALGESFSIGTINNKDNPEYILPPDARDLDSAGVQGREQSLRLSYNGLTGGREMLMQKTNPGGRSQDFTLYNRMNYFVFSPAGSDSVEFFFRTGTDSLNYYEVARRLDGGNAWREVIFELQSLTDLKFPEDIGVEEDTLNLYGRPVVQVTRFVEDRGNPDVILRMTRRGNPSLKNVTRMFCGVRHLSALPPIPLPGDRGDRTHIKNYPAPSTGEVWFNNVRLEDVTRDVGVAQVYSGQASFADVFDVNVSFSNRGADFRGLRERTGSGRDLLNLQNRMSTELSRVLPTLGLTVPVTYTFSRSVARPKFFSQSDTENTAERAHEQRDESVRRGLGLSINKRPSKFWLFKPTIDRVSFSYNQSKDERRAYATRDTSKAWSQNLNYDLSPKDRSFPIGFKQRLNLLPTNIRFTVRHQKSRGVSWTVPDPRTEVQVRKPNRISRSLSMSGSAAFRPMQIVSTRYNFNEPRSYRDAHPDNASERVKLWGLDFGIPSGRSEALAFDLTPRLFRFSYAGNYGDNRITSVAMNGTPEPDRHQFSATRTRRLSFDFGLHRRLARWKFIQAQQQDQQRREPPPRNSAADSVAAVDSTASAPKRPVPNPLKFLLRKVGSIDPVKVELSDSRTAAYAGVPQEASYAYRFGFSLDSGAPGFSIPTPVNRTNNIDLTSAIPLRGALRLTMRYARRETEIEATSLRDSSVNRNTTLEKTFPSLDLNVSDLQKIRIFGPKLERSTLSIGYNRTTSERANRDFDSAGDLRRESNVRKTTTTTINSNWTGQWSGATSTNLTFSQNGTAEDVPGQKRQGTRRNIQGNLRFRIAPQGGLKLPIFGTLKTGMDVIVTAGYNTDESKVFNQLDTNPDFFIVDRKSSSINVSTRGDYTLSRSMNGGIEIGYTRNNNARSNQTITTLRLGFNLTFLF